MQFVAAELIRSFEAAEIYAASWQLSIHSFKAAEIYAALWLRSRYNFEAAEIYAVRDCRTYIHKFQAAAHTN